MREPIRNVFYGQGLGPNLYLAGSGATDGGQPVVVRALTNPFSPAGEGGEALFTGLTLTVTHTMAATIRVTPYVDDVALTDAIYDLPLTATVERETVTWELGLAVSERDPADPSQVLATLAPRGTRMQVLIEVLAGDPPVPGLVAGDLLFETPTLEYEIVRESRPAETPVAA